MSIPKFDICSSVGHLSSDIGWNYIKLLPNIYDHSVVMHMKFHQYVTSYGGVIAY